MKKHSNDKRPPMVVAMYWVHQLTSISLEMVLPALGGLWLDNRWETSPWLVSLGAVLGFWVGFKHLLSLTQGQSRKSSRPRDGSKSSDE